MTETGEHSSDIDESARELLLAHIGRFAAYHSQKETMTWSAATAYVVAVSVLLATGRDPFWHLAPWWKFWSFALLLGLTAVGAFKFIGRQYERRQAAHRLVHACSNVATRWLTHRPMPPDLIAEDLAEHGFLPGHDFQLMPRAVIQELVELEKHPPKPLPRFGFHDRQLTSILMWAWTVAGVARLFLAWRPIAAWLGS